MRGKGREGGGGMAGKEGKRGGMRGKEGRKEGRER